MEEELCQGVWRLILKKFEILVAVNCAPIPIFLNKNVQGNLSLRRKPKDVS